VVQRGDRRLAICRESVRKAARGPASCCPVRPHHTQRLADRRRPTPCRRSGAVIRPGRGRAHRGPCPGQQQKRRATIRTSVCTALGDRSQGRNRLGQRAIVGATAPGLPVASQLGKFGFGWAFIGSEHTGSLVGFGLVPQTRYVTGQLQVYAMPSPHMQFVPMGVGAGSLRTFVDGGFADARTFINGTLLPTGVQASVVGSWLWSCSETTLGSPALGPNVHVASTSTPHDAS